MKSIIFFLLLFVPLSQAREERDLVILVDRSRSVEPANRESALQLIAGLVSGRVEDATRQDWQVDPASQASDEAALLPERERLKGIFEGKNAGSIALEKVEFLIAGLGNYQRTAELGEALAKSGAARISRDEVASSLLGAAGDFGSDDVSTHIKLAEAIVAKRLLAQADRQGSHYLIVVSDFEEDCFNRPVSEYATPAAKVIELNGERLTLADANRRVHDGKADYNDGRDGRGRYSPTDVEAIGYFRQNVEQLKLMDFVYRGDVGSGKLPVRVRFYAQARKRSLAFETDELRWIFPDDPPEIGWVASGVSADADLTLTSAAGGKVEYKGDIAAKDGKPYRTPLADLMEELFPGGLPPGPQELKLLVSDPADPRPLEAVTTLELVVPQTLRFEEERHQAATRESPAEIPARSELRNERFDGMIEPAPAKCEVTITMDIGAGSTEPVTVTTVAASDGKFKFALSDLTDDLLRRMMEVELVGIRASLVGGAPLPDAVNLPAAQCFLKMPATVGIWADEFESEKIELDLSRRLGITFKSTHAGMPGYQWSRPRITFQDGTVPTAVAAGRNNVTFARNADPGTYTIRVSMLQGDDVVADKAYSVTVLERGNWLLYALVGMAVASLGLFGWHFFGRR